MTKEEKQAASDAAMAEFFARGGKVQQLEPNQSGRVEGETAYSWSKKKPAATVAPTVPDEE